MHAAASRRFSQVCDAFVESLNPAMSQHASAQDDADCLLLQRLRSTPELFEAIAACTPAELASQKTLRARFDDELVRAALAVFDARQRANGLLPNVDQLWLTRVGLEQSTAWPVACHKARRFASVPDVADLCCGIGIDAAALTHHASVEAIDCDPAMCLRTNWNVAELGQSDRLRSRSADVASESWAGRIVHADPDRRSGRDRPTKRLELYRPDLLWMQQLTRSAAGGAIKIGSASNFLQKFPGCEIELVSLDGECREATVWFGDLNGAHPFRATVLPGDETISADPLSEWTNVAPAVGAYLLDPDPAVVRSGLLDVVAARFELRRLDADEEYLTSDNVPATAFATPFCVEAVLPNKLAALKRHLRERPSTHYEVKCRRIPIDADAVRRSLPTGTHGPRVVLFARVAGRAAIIVATRTVAFDPQGAGRDGTAEPRR